MRAPSEGSHFVDAVDYEQDASVELHDPGSEEPEEFLESVAIGDIGNVGCAVCLCRGVERVDFFECSVEEALGSQPGGVDSDGSELGGPHRTTSGSHS